MGRGDAGTWGHGTRGRGDSGTRGRGTRGRGTRGRGTRGRRDVGMRGRRNSGTSGRKDAINKQHLNFALNLQFTIIDEKEKGMMESLPVTDDFQHPWSP